MSEQPKKQTLKSLNIAEHKREQLKQLFPEVFDEGGIDFDALKSALGECAAPVGERFGLSWHGKAACKKTIQQPSIATLKPNREQSVDFDETENLFIEGDNLEVLKLLQKSYFGKVKMIYIDPPYNTGKEFIYPDKYGETLNTYLEYTGQKDSEGRKFSTNTESEGRYHSNWLNMMYPRLYLARNLLREDGVIFISIDDNEQDNLKKLCNEIFGEENFLSTIVWNSTKSVTNTALISNSHSYNLIYAKDKDFFKENRHSFRFPESGDGFSNPDNDHRGKWKADPFQVGGWRPNQQYEITNPNTGEKYLPNPGSSWKNELVKFEQLMKENRIVFGVSGEAGPSRKRFLSEAKKRGRVSKTWWDDVGTTSNGTIQLKELFDESAVFNNPKPTDLIEKMVQLGDHTKQGVILDFFAGSATTAHAVMQLNAEDGGKRKYICVQLPEPCDEKTEAHKAGYQTIADIGRERIRRAAKKIAAEKDSQKYSQKRGEKLDLGFKAFSLAPSNFAVWEGDVDKIKNLEKQLELHADHIDPSSSSEDILYELLLKSGFALTAPIETMKLAGKQVFSINAGNDSNHSNALLICLEKQLTQKLMDAIADKNPAQVICLDAGFQSNDQLKTNAVQTFKSRTQREESEIVFRTV